MKTIGLLILLTFMASGSDSIIGKYKIDSNSKIDVITIHRNGRFLYEDRGDSCWTWTDREGTWNLKSDTLILVEIRPIAIVDEETYEILERSTTVKEHKFLIRKKELKLISSDLFIESVNFNKL